MQIRLHKDVQDGLIEVAKAYRKQGFEPSITELGNVLLLQAIRGKLRIANGRALKGLKR